MKIIIHHSATKDGKTVSWDDIKRYHIYHNDWDDIGYHFGIEAVDNSYEILMGRMPNVQGAHCRGHNHNTIGICCVGNYDLIQPSKFMLVKLTQLLDWLIFEYNIKISNIKGHRDFASKSCPGKLFDLENVRRNLHEKIKKNH